MVANSLALNRHNHAVSFPSPVLVVNRTVYSACMLLPWRDLSIDRQKKNFQDTRCLCIVAIYVFHASTATEDAASTIFCIHERLFHHDSGKENFRDFLYIILRSMHPAGERWTVVETEKGPNLALHPAADFFFLKYFQLQIYIDLN